MADPLTLPGRLLARARALPDHVALREKRLGLWQETTWAGYRDRVEATALAFEALGVQPGDHVGILSDNCPEWLIADLAAQSLGARGVGIYATNSEADVGWILNHARCVLLVCEDQEQLDKALALGDQIPSVQHLIVIDPRGTRDVQDTRLLTWQALEARGEALRNKLPGAFDARVAGLDPDAPAMIVYTSGTTGTPKGAMLSGRNALSAADQMVSLLRVSPDDQLLSYLPLCHVAEKIFSLFLPLSSGATVHFGESLQTVQQDLREVSPTIFLGVPRIWEKMHASVTLRMLDATPLKRQVFRRCTAATRKLGPPGTHRSWRDRLTWGLADLLVLRALQEHLGLRRCRLAVSGAAPVGTELLSWFHAIGVPIAEGYGMTECAGVSHITLPDQVRLGAVGKVLPDLECVLGEDGEVLLRGPEVFLGYLHDPEATQQTVDPEGWLHTGDIGAIDADGFLRITGRKKEILITAGGKNLSPEKIENALKTSPYLKEAVAIGDQRHFISALVQIDADAVGDWATRQAIPYTDFEDLTRQPQVIALVNEEVKTANKLLSPVEQVRAIRLLPKELHQDDGELTATQKVRRRAVTAAWSALIEEMYG